MKDTYNLREVIDEELKSISLSKETIEGVKEKCLAGRQVDLKRKKYYQIVVKVAIWFLCTLGIQRKLQKRYTANC